MTPLEAILKSLTITGVIGTAIFTFFAIKSYSRVYKQNDKSEEARTPKESSYSKKGKQLYFNFGDYEYDQLYFDFMKNYS